MCRISLLGLILCLLTSILFAGPIVTTHGYIPAAASGQAPIWRVQGVPNYVGGTAQDQQYNIDTFWWDDIYPNKNHNVASWTGDVLTDFSAYGSGKLEAESIALGLAPGVSIVGDYELGVFQAGFTEDGYTYPGGTPVYFQGGTPGSGLVFSNVKDRLAVQFFSSDKNDGYVELWVNGEFVTRYDSWCQGWWWLEVTNLNPEAADVVELRTSVQGGPHLNTLNLNASSENWMRVRPGQTGYPQPDDFHVDYVAYTPFELVPEPGSLLLVLSGSAILGWARRRRAQS